MRWNRGWHYGGLTIIVVAHDLVELAYPFVESFVSAVPLGCRYLVGVAGCRDDTVAFYERLGDFAPIRIVEIPWRVEAGGGAIGLATQSLINLSVTPWVYNLQASEVLSDNVGEGVAESLNNWTVLRPGWARFRHFFGGFSFDGGERGHAYPTAPRLFARDRVDLSGSDGYCSPDWGGPGLPYHPMGWVYRYSWTFENQVRAKSVSHYALYRGEAQSPGARLASIRWCRENPNYFGGHPSSVRHLVHSPGRGDATIIDYDVELSMRVVTGALAPYRADRVIVAR
jgi:hypothetical protein